MSHLLLLRHGKSDWSDATLGDHERPLKSRGEKAARRMGRLLSEHDFAPDRVLASSAVRALSTARLAHREGAWDCELEVGRGLYLASAEELLAALRSLPATCARPLLVAHEPGCSELVARLTGGRAPRFPTAALARIDLGSTPWPSVSAGCGRLEWLLPPRLL